jgi:hypothetical protein
LEFILKKVKIKKIWVPMKRSSYPNGPKSNLNVCHKVVYRIKIFAIS